MTEFDRYLMTLQSYVEIMLDAQVAVLEENLQYFRLIWARLLSAFEVHDAVFDAYL